jgi:hypothetical protein
MLNENLSIQWAAHFVFNFKKEYRVINQSEKFSLQRLPVLFEMQFIINEWNGNDKKVHTNYL